MYAYVGFPGDSIQKGRHACPYGKHLLFLIFFISTPLAIITAKSKISEVLFIYILFYVINIIYYSSYSFGGGGKLLFIRYVFIVLGLNCIIFLLQHLANVFLP